MKKLQVDVEPLSESRWRKVDEAVFAAIEAPSMRPAPLKKKPRWVIPAAAGAVAVAAAIAFLVVKRPEPPAIAASHIETGAGRSMVQIGSATVDVGPASEVTTSGDDTNGVVVVLEHGSVDCEVAPRRGRPPFVVQAGSVRVTVVGTHFTVRRELDGTTVLVTRGIVDVAYDGQVTHVSAGESWPAPTASVTAMATASGPASAAPIATSLPSFTPPKPVLSDQAQYERAAAMESKDPDGATGIYLRLANKGGPWAANALFAAGRLASERGNRAEATRLLSQYLDRYPNGANADDARRLLAGLR